MKKTTTIMLFLSFTLLLYSQADKDFYSHNWKVGKSKIINGNTINRHEGGNNRMSITNIGYESLAQVLSKLENDAEKQMWTPEEKKKKIDFYKSFAPGGCIELYITRSTISAANNEMFSVIVKDSTDLNEIHRETLDNDIPSYSSYNHNWWNTAYIFIPDNIKGNFFIYIIDRLGDDNSKFKFEVKL